MKETAGESCFSCNTLCIKMNVFLEQAELCRILCCKTQFFRMV